MDDLNDKSIVTSDARTTPASGTLEHLLLQAECCEPVDEAFLRTLIGDSEAGTAINRTTNRRPYVVDEFFLCRLAGLPITSEPESPTDSRPPVDENSVDECRFVDEPIFDEPIVDEPIVDEPIVDEPVVADAIVEEEDGLPADDSSHEVREPRHDQESCNRTSTTDVAAISQAEEIPASQQVLGDAVSPSFGLRRVVIVVLIASLAFAALAAGFFLRDIWQVQGHAATPSEVSQPAPHAISIDEVERRITAAVGDVTLFQKSLSAYVEKDPESPRSAEFRQVLAGELDVFRHVEQWNNLVQRLHSQAVLGLSPDEADLLRRDLVTQLPLFSKLPGAEYLRLQLEVLDPIAARRGAEGRSLRDALIEQFQSPSLNMPFVVQTLDGKRYYFLERPTTGNGKLKGEYLVDLDSTLRPMEIALTAVDKANTGRLTHASLCEKAIAMLQQLEHSNWERIFVELLATIRDEPAVDPAIRAYLIRLVLEAGCEGSLRLRSTFVEYQSIAGSIELDADGSWLDPDNPAALTLRPYNTINYRK